VIIRILFTEKKMKKLSIAVAAIALSSAAFVSPQAFAVDVGVNIVIGSPPPAPRYEVVPAPRYGYLWVPGFWDWNGRHYVWISGHWEHAREGYAYRRPEWHEEHGRWILERGRWEHEHHDEGRHEGWYKEHNHGREYDRHDRDHDGVPDRYDHHPDNPHRD
jgi:hypothetical protein